MHIWDSRKTLKICGSGRRLGGNILFGQLNITYIRTISQLSKLANASIQIPLTFRKYKNVRRQSKIDTRSDYLQRIHPKKWVSDQDFQKYKKTESIHLFLSCAFAMKNHFWYLIKAATILNIAIPTSQNNCSCTFSILACIRRKSACISRKSACSPRKSAPIWFCICRMSAILILKLPTSLNNVLNCPSIEPTLWAGVAAGANAAAPAKTRPLKAKTALY